jgi:hypothetical protein
MGFTFFCTCYQATPISIISGRLHCFFSSLMRQHKRKDTDKFIVFAKPGMAKPGFRPATHPLCGRGIEVSHDRDGGGGLKMGVEGG